jgi:hypothetical protein
MAKHEGQFTPGQDANRFFGLPPASREQLMEESAINAKHHRSRADFVARAGGDGFRGRRIMLLGDHRQVAAHIGKRRMRDRRVRSGGENAMRVQQLVGQIQSAPPGIFGEIAKDIRELPSSASSSATRSPAGVSSPKIRTESRPIATATRSQYKSRSARLGARMSAHASISMPPMMARKSLHCRPYKCTAPLSTRDGMLRPSGVEQRNFAAPAGQQNSFQRGGCIAVCDIVNFATQRAKRTSPRAANAVGAASPRKTSLPRRVCARRSRCLECRVHRCLGVHRVRKPSHRIVR